MCILNLFALIDSCLNSILATLATLTGLNSSNISGHYSVSNGHVDTDV
jgi:hypothetical protein